MSHQHHPLGSWQLGGDGLQRNLDRRVLVRSALGAGAAVAVLAASGSAHALTLEKTPASVLGAIPPRKGVVSWATLAAVETAPGHKARFPADVAKLNGHHATIEGHMMVLDDDDPLKRFLLTAYKAHCPFCMPGGFASIVAVHAERPLRVTDKLLTMRGTLRLLNDPGSQLVYRLERAILA
jgi:hypothetical protein